VPQGASYTTRFSLLDVYKGQEIGTWDVPAMPAPQLRRMGHIIADIIYEKVTGVRGCFDTQIAYISVTGMGSNRVYQLVIADSDGENPHIIATSKEPMMSPSWSRDRTRIAYVGYDRGHSAIYVQTPATGEWSKYVAEKGINGAPAWSPDGRYLAVTLSFETNPDLYVIDLQTRQRRRITDAYGIDTSADWAPDSQSLVFTSDRGGSPQVYRVSVNGGQVQRLTFEGKRNEDPKFSPDGKSLVLVNSDGGSFRIALFDLVTQQITRFLSDGWMDESPSFAPNGAVVIYTTLGAKGTELATITIDGRVRRSLTQVGAEVREPAWSPFMH